MSKKSGGDLVGSTVKGYKIIKMIGEGKFSFVYRAENQSKIPYALKNIKIFDMADQKQRDKCLKQIDLMKALEHPNIIRYIDSFIENNQLYIVTEWAEKGDLKKQIKEHISDEIPFEEHTIWEYIKQISSALKHMHDRKIMHRDLKPANIFISHDLTLKIGDLGLGRAFGTQTLEAYSKVGTPLYMSPQLIQDAGYNFNADVWSLGCITYELCELSSPFRNKQQKMSLMDLFNNITECKYKPISSKYSTQLSQVIKKMIVVDPNYRLSSENVLQIAEKNLKGIKKPLLDPYIVMDDIHIKLTLLDYPNNFCKAAQRPPINKFYFAIPDPANQSQQLNYFLELCYWILGLAKPGSHKKEKLAMYTKTQIDWSSPQSACRKLLADLMAANIRMDEIKPESILDGYGQTICYLLNEVLNRQLIRSNFQFKEPQHSPILVQEAVEDKNQGQNDQENEEKMSIHSESVEQQSQFQQSVFFNKNLKKIGNEDHKLLEKIQEYGGDEEDKEMIVGRIDEFEWKAECLRVEKKLTDISSFAKQARKKQGHQHFDTIKINSAKITDLVRGAQPSVTRLFNLIDQQLDTIKKGETRLNKDFSSIGSEYSQKSTAYKDLATRSSILSTSLKQKMQQGEHIEQKIEEFNSKIKLAMQENENNRVVELKNGIKNLQKQIKDMQQRQGILVWQLRNMMMRSRNDKKQQIKEMQFQEF